MGINKTIKNKVGVVKELFFTVHSGADVTTPASVTAIAH